MLTFFTEIFFPIKIIEIRVLDFVMGCEMMVIFIYVAEKDISSGDSEEFGDQNADASAFFSNRYL